LITVTSLILTVAFTPTQMEDVFTRAAKGGSGGIKAVGNYAGSLLPQVLLARQHEHVLLPFSGFRLAFYMLRKGV
jgi:hypothetical protein